jgi:uncharacterized protein (TIGR02001 family)
MPIDDHDRQPSLPAPALTGALAFFLAALAAAPGAFAQTSADVTLVSEYAIRGVSMGPRPALQLRVDHDFDGGWYAGTFASPISLYGRGQGLLIVYGGRALPLTSRLSWDAGITRTIYLRNHEADYHEFYAGLTLDRVNARLSYSPAYYGAVRTVYLDLNGGDLRATLAYDMDDWRLQAGWQTLIHGSGSGFPRARALVASISWRY